MGAVFLDGGINIADKVNLGGASSNPCLCSKPDTEWGLGANSMLNALLTLPVPRANIYYRILFQHIIKHDENYK